MKETRFGEHIKVDERDTMFSRMSLEEGSKEYKYYYDKNPDQKEFDDEIRLKPNLCSEGTATYNPILSKIADSNFKYITDIRQLSEGIPNPVITEIEPVYATHLFSELALHNGAVKVGIVELKDKFLYSHRGRHKENYGDAVHLDHKYGIVFAVEMDKEMMNRAPQVASVIETSKAYIDAATVGMQLSYYLRELGYEARNHMDGNYLVHCVSMAYEAGLGEVGRNSLLATLEHGSRIRLGIVTTNLELVPSGIKEYGLKDLCVKCRKCIRTCPGKAINSEDIVDYWQIDQQSCYNRWRSLGTDCGICVSTCPLSQDSPYDLFKDEIKNKEDKESFWLDDRRIDVVVKHFEDQYGIRPYNKKPWPEEKEKVTGGDK